MTLLSKRFVLLAILLTAVAINASAADVSGTWKGTAETPNGTVERTFIFKVSGETVTGETSSSMMGKSAIEDGKVSGDTITFDIQVKFQDQEFKLSYKGKIAGETINFKVAAPDGTTIAEYVAKKVS